MDLSLYFEPVSAESLHLSEEELDGRLLHSVMLYDPSSTLDVSEADIAILGVPEVRNAYRNPSCSLAPDEIRRQFYQLFPWRRPVRILDLGNLRVGRKVSCERNIWFNYSGVFYFMASP